MWRGLEKWPGAGSHRLHTPWRSWDLEMTGSLTKDFKQRDMVRLVFKLDHSRLCGVTCCLPGSPSAVIAWFILNGQEICSDQASLKSPSQLH